MTDNDIIKALSCTGGHDEDLMCRNCYYGSGGDRTYMTCCKNVTKDAIDLINRQKAEIERLQTDGETLVISLLNAKKEIERLNKDIDIIQSANVELYSALDNARAEAITEFAEKLKDRYADSPADSYTTIEVLFSRIDQTAKEMKGEQ